MDHQSNIERSHSHAYGTDYIGPIWGYPHCHEVCSIKVPCIVYPFIKCNHIWIIWEANGGGGGGGLYEHIYQHLCYM